MNQDSTHYDIIVVGGRPAGATLAARLGQAGLRVLLLERARLPSPPAASSPVIYPATMHLLDEIGADERAYARNTAPIHRLVSDVLDDLRVSLRVPASFGRDYIYAIDRERFDAELWRTAASSPNVDARDGLSVSDLLRDGERVMGVLARAPGGPELRFSADWVVGADGRFSIVARKAGARTLDEHTDLPTTIYYAYWQGVEPHDEGGPTIVSYGTGRGFGYGLMDSADGRTCVVIEGRASALELGDAKPAELMQTLLRSHPRIWRRLAHAQPATEVRGMRNIGNLYREAGGPGWVLVGDALHQKDPLDGQGIYDAVLTAKLLAQALIDCRRGALSRGAALARYAAEVRAATYPMYVETLARVKRELYTEHPNWAYRSWLRWLVTDPEYQRRIMALLSRQLDAEGWLPSSVFFRALGRGALADLGRLLVPWQAARRLAR